MALTVGQSRHPPLPSFGHIDEKRLNGKTNFNGLQSTLTVFVSRAQFANPVNNISNGSFGRILLNTNDGSNGTGTSRQLKFSLRLDF
ncbi:MAG: hypothetical protein NTW74_10395 [Acidobacteria bacterium]|nr:hypothetical protein [Acidobacteriota bacterium]